MGCGNNASTQIDTNEITMSSNTRLASYMFVGAGEDFVPAEDGPVEVTSFLNSDSIAIVTAENDVEISGLDEFSVWTVAPGKMNDLEMLMRSYWDQFKETWMADLFPGTLRESTDLQYIVTAFICSGIIESPENFPIECPVDPDNGEQYYIPEGLFIKAVTDVTEYEFIDHGSMRVLILMR